MTKPVIIIHTTVGTQRPYSAKEVGGDFIREASGSLSQGSGGAAYKADGHYKPRVLRVATMATLYAAIGKKYGSLEAVDIQFAETTQKKSKVAA